MEGQCHMSPQCQGQEKVLELWKISPAQVPCSLSTSQPPEDTRSVLKAQCEFYFLMLVMV